MKTESFQMALQKVRTMLLTLSRLARLMLVLGKLRIHVIYFRLNIKFKEHGKKSRHLKKKKNKDFIFLEPHTILEILTISLPLHCVYDLNGTLIQETKRMHDRLL